MKVEMLTKEDLQIFKQELISEISVELRRILTSKGGNLQQKEWIKSYEVRKLLSISPGKLQNMRINGSIAYTRIGGLMFYKYEDIMKMMEANKNQKPLIAKHFK